MPTNQTGPWWLAPPRTTPDAHAAPGLSSAQAALLLARHGPNLLRERAAHPLLVQYLMRFKNPLVLVLLGAGVVSAFTRELANFLIISIMILLSVTLDFVQEYRANSAAEKLRLSVCLRAKVLRDAKSSVIPVAELVPGDVVLLSAGDLVPADGQVLEARNFFVSQAMLTGESYPVEKRPDMPPATATDIQGASNAVFMGTSVISGSARMRVAQTGAATAIGALADSMRQPSPPTSFEIGTRRFGLLIMRLTVSMVMFVLLVNTLFHRPLLESFLFAVALAVGLTPELLPMVVSVTLARGAQRMARKQMVVKRLTAIQDLGSMDTLCTDKTGTLTEASIALERHVDALGQSSERTLELAYLNSFFETGLKSPLDDAILNHRHIAIAAWRKIDEVPFDFERRRVSVLIDNGTTRWLVVKGAPDEIMPLCTGYDDNVASLPLDKPAQGAVRERYRALEAEGLRVLAVAWREVPPQHSHAIVTDETELVLAGFAAFLDPPKASAASALASLRQLGVTIKIVTGDSDLVTRHVCGLLNIAVDGVLTGTQIARMDDNALRASVEKTNLFCRINPMEKNRIILALKARGHVVGYLGDGINDAPSLLSADVGLSVDSAVDVAREAADIILLRHDLQMLHAGVLEGRRTFGNIMKYIMMGTSSNFGNMFSMAGAALFLPFLPMTPTQILLNNILYDISEMPIPLDTVEHGDLRHPSVLDLQFVRNFMLVVGLASSLFDLLTFAILLLVLQAHQAQFQTGWFVESLCTQVMVIFVIRTRGNPFKSRAHPSLVAASLAVVGLALLLPFTAAGQYVGLVPLPLRFYAMLGAMLLLYLWVVEMIKQRFYLWIASTKQRAASGGATALHG